MRDIQHLVGEASERRVRLVLGETEADEPPALHPMPTTAATVPARAAVSRLRSISLAKATVRSSIGGICSSSFADEARFGNAAAESVQSDDTLDRCPPKTVGHDLVTSLEEKVAERLVPSP